MEVLENIFQNIRKFIIIFGIKIRIKQLEIIEKNKKTLLVLCTSQYNSKQTLIRKFYSKQDNVAPHLKFLKLPCLKKSLHFLYLSHYRLKIFT